MNLFGWLTLSPAEIMLGMLCVGTLGAIVVLAIVVLATRKSVPPNPNLYPCPDCGRLLSREAPACPQCGKPLQTS